MADPNTRVCERWMADYELGLRNAIKKVFGGDDVTVNGCYFHYKVNNLLYDWIKDQNLY